MDDVPGRAWVAGVATDAARSANKVLRDQRISGFLFWEPRTNHPTLRCELGGSVLVLLQAINGRAVARLSHGLNDKLVQLGTLADADQAKLQRLLLDFVECVLAERRARQVRRPPPIGPVRVEGAEVGAVSARGGGRGGGAGRGAGIGRGSGRAV